MQHRLASMRRLVAFQGRTRRREYWTFQLVYFGLLLGGLLLDALLMLTLTAGPITFAHLGGFPPVTLTLCVLLALPNAAVTARRLHDAGYSGWLQLLNAVPTFFLALVILTLQDSQTGANTWGADPKAAQHRPRHHRRAWWTTYLGNIP